MWQNDRKNDTICAHENDKLMLTHSMLALSRFLEQKVFLESVELAAGLTAVVARVHRDALAHATAFDGPGPTTFRFASPYGRLDLKPQPWHIEKMW